MPGPPLLSMLMGASACMLALVVSVGAQKPLPAPAASAGNPHQSGSLFVHSDNCMSCHNNLTTAEGEDVSIGTSWQSTIMANSARDPYFHASVRRETTDHPARRRRSSTSVRPVTCPSPRREPTLRAGSRRSCLQPEPTMPRTHASHGMVCRARSVTRSPKMASARRRPSTATSRFALRGPTACARFSDRSRSMPADRQSCGRPQASSR